MDNFEKIEQDIDGWLYELLDENIPRYKYIYHCNMAYTDIMVDYKIIFTTMERHCLFALNYLTHIAYLKLKEEEVFDYSIDSELYQTAFMMLLHGMHYSILCDNFTKVHSGDSRIHIQGNKIKFDTVNPPRSHYKYLNDFIMRMGLNYTLQLANEKLLQDGENDEIIAMKLMDVYMHYWDENMCNEDYEPYSAMDWCGISTFFIIAAMRRFNKLYKQNMDITKLKISDMLIIISPGKVPHIRDYVPSTNDAMYNQALEDHIYKPLGTGLYPKENIAHAPLVRTKDGYIFANALVILFNDSLESQFLDCMRKYDNKRYLRIKDKIKEREIPLIQRLVEYKLSNIKVITNCNVKIPGTRKNKRECDVILVDEHGFVLYLEVKDYYNPQSWSEKRSLDKELSEALEKLPKQLEAIEMDWEKIKAVYDISCNITSIQGMIVSHNYTGVNVPIEKGRPIVRTVDLISSIVSKDSLKDIYMDCCEIDNIYPKRNMRLLHIQNINLS